MIMEITAAEFKELFKGPGSPDELFEMLKVDIGEQVDRYFTILMRTELTGFLGRESYERQQEPSNHRKGSYVLSITLKGIGEVTAKVARDRLGRPIEPRFFLVAAGTRGLLRKM